MRTVAVVNQKGGTAKTTTARETAAVLASRGLRTVLIDLDGQADLTGFFTGGAVPEATVADVLAGREDALGAVVPSGREGLDLLPATDRAYLLLEQGNVTPADVRAALRRLATRYDWAVLDFPRAVSPAILATLAACDLAVVPTEASRASAEAAVRTLGTLALLADAPEAAVLIVKSNARTRIGREYADLIEGAAADAGAHLFDTRISLATAVPEAEGYGLTLAEHKPGSKPALEYVAYVSELLELAGNENGN